MSKHIVNVPITKEKEEQFKDVHRAALNHWISREKPAKRETWPVMYEQPVQNTNIPCPPGIDQSYWQNLSKIEQRWSAGPVQTPTLEQRRQLWQQMDEIKNIKEGGSAKSDYFSEAIRPADPFEEPIKRKAQLLSSNADGKVVAFAQKKQVWKLASNE